MWTSLLVCSLYVWEFHDVDMHINACVTALGANSVVTSPGCSRRLHEAENAPVSVRLPELYGGLHSGGSRVRGSWCYIVWRKCPRPEATVYFWKVAYVRVWLQRPFKHAREALITIIRVTRWKTWISNEQSAFVCCHRLGFLHSGTITVIHLKCFYNWKKTLEGFQRRHVSKCIFLNSHSRAGTAFTRSAFVIHLSFVHHSLKESL